MNRITRGFCFLILTLTFSVFSLGVHADGDSRGRGETTAVFKIPPDADAGTVVGSSTLKRSKRGVEVSIETSRLEAGYTYTVWAAIFNYPEYCVADCSDADLLGIGPGADARLQPSLVYLTGRIAPGDSDVTNFKGSIKKGDMGVINRDLLVGRGLLNPKGAEIHVVIRCHGAPLFPDLVAVSEQMTSYGGGCDVNECVDVQAGLHRP